MLLQHCYPYILLITVCLSTAQIKVYDSYQPNDLISRLQHDCLYYQVDDKVVQYGEAMQLVYQLIPYCIRSNGNITKGHIVPDSGIYEAKTFEELRQLNITSEQLIIWSAPINIAERYEMYLTHCHIEVLSMERFHNCTWPWFGHRCEYSFDVNQELSFAEFAFNIFQSKNKKRFMQLDRFTNLSCYVHLLCMRGQEPLCLDWREICDGKVDCLNDGVDEEDCWQLEIKECSINEYRCHNGAQCIPEHFLHDDRLNPDCLDRSDEPLSQLYPELCPADPAFRCEEHICIYSRNELIFSCGDGQCIGMSDQCTNERSIIYLPSYLLLHNCSRAMACLTLTRRDFDDVLCEKVCHNSRCTEIVREQCPPLFQFPPMYVLFGHVFFVYTNDQPDYSTRISSLPKFVCYKEQLCDSYLPSIALSLFNDSKCINFSEFDVSKKPISRRTWNDLLTSVKGFFQGCSTHKKLTNATNCLHSSLYRCTNSFTCISTHRLLDGNQDCYMLDDETFNQSCNLEDQHRFQCPLENRCISSTLVYDFKTDCLDNEDENLPDFKISETHISFQTICDGFQELSIIDIDGKNESDETNCHRWPCNNSYTRCNDIWNCLDGADEVNCSQSNCPLSHHRCVSPVTNNFTCLPIAQANDGFVDCLGGSDERHICRRHYPQHLYRRFLCRNHTDLETMCLQPNHLCNQQSTCSHRDDEVFCLVRHNFSTKFFCDSLLPIQRTDVETFLCGLTDVSKKLIVYFSLYSDQINKRIAYSSNQPDEHHSAPDRFPNNDDLTSKLARTWRCNRGLPIRTRDHTLICLCPPSYYGDHCQYQNQRVSLTLQLQAAANFRMVFTMVIMLIDEDGQIHSFERLNYLPIRHCHRKFNMYLLYSARPKNSAKNYSIRIDAFIATALSYRASWLYLLEFPFLPVHRLAVQLLIPIANSHTIDCMLDCNYGRCRRYENTGRDFCQCDSGWSGSRCLVKHDNYTCSPDSFHSGPSLCICSLGKYGKQCSLNQSICSNTYCQPHGQCVPIDERMVDYQWECICGEGYSGPTCDRIDRKVIVSFHDIIVPLSIRVHFIYPPGHAPHERTTTFKKIPLDQDTATVYSSTPFHLVIVQIFDNYYLTTLPQSEFVLNMPVYFNVIASQQCQPIEHLLDDSIVHLHLVQRIKYYHLPCEQRSTLVCFYDSIHMCFCNEDRHANCFEYEHDMAYNCQGVNYCLNGARCYQDNTTCPSAYLCECTECYYGTRCLLTTKETSLSLDAILGNQIRPHVAFTQQPIVIKISAITTIIMFILGIVDGYFSCMTFKARTLREVGCGYYLFILAIISSVIMSILSMKFVILLLTQMSVITHRSFLFIQCISIDFLLISMLRLNSWLNACVSLERAVTIVKGIHFHKGKSKYGAKWVILFLLIMVISTTIHDPMHRHLIDDIEEQRTWCVVKYTGYLRIFNSMMTLCHFIIPFGINLISALVIIIIGARTRSTVRIDLSYQQHLYKQFHQHQHLLISPIILVLLGLPYLIISFLSGCMKSIREPWLYLFGFYTSFIPPALVFVIYVLPSKTYKKEFFAAMNCLLSSIRHVK